MTKSTIQKIVKTCEFCGKEYETSSLTSKFCNASCSAKDKRRQQNILKAKNSTGRLECKICGYRNDNTIQAHITNTHRMKMDDYYAMYNCSKLDVHSEEYLNQLSERCSGDKNPGYQHGGKLSPFSKKNTKFTEEERLAHIKKAADSRDENDSITTRIEYYLNRGYSQEEAEIMLRQRQQTFSLKICQEKHGKVGGYIVWKDRQIKWQDTLNNLPDDEKQRILYEKVLGSNQSIIGKSLIANELFDSFEIPNAEYGHNEKLIKMNNTYIKPDFTYENKIIEFYGDYWHANPEKYDINKQFQFPRGRKSAQDIWDKDNERIEHFKKMGYEVLIIWESEYNEDKEGIRQKCLEFLRE